LVFLNSLSLLPLITITTVLPAELEVIAINPNDNEIMGLQHTALPLYSVQFHPESICSRRSNYGLDAGKQILRNFMMMVDKFWLANGRPKRLPLTPNIRNLSVLNLTELDPMDPPSAKQFVEPPISHVSHYRIERHDISLLIPPTAQNRPELVFEATSYSSSHPFYWLDSAAAAPGDGFARFTYMGPATLEKCVSYDLVTNVISCGAHKQLELKAGDTFWDWMDRVQSDLARHVNTGEGPEGFLCGFVGYFGYEMKAGALPGYTSPPVNDRSASHAPDAQFMFADRLISYDHWSKSWAVLGLIRDELEISTRTLFERETGVSVGMSNHEFASWVDAIKQKLGRLWDTGVSALSPPAEPLPLSFTYNSTSEAYKSAIKACKSHIADGNSYELCLTGQYTASASETTLDYLIIYNHFRVQNPASHAAFVSFPATQTTIMSCSPELFIRFDGANGRQAIMKPIKGTLKRCKCRCGGLCKLPACGSRKAECDAARHKSDEQRIRAFVNDPKETAENLMVREQIC
jgi:para-aminobenzoate synthetase